MNKFGLPERTVDELLTYFKSMPDIELVKIYGSRAKGTYHNGSDIDFALWIGCNVSILRISNDLEELPTPYKYDVIDYKTLSHKEMKESIDKEGIIFYKKNK